MSVPLRLTTFGRTPGLEGFGTEEFGELLEKSTKNNLPIKRDGGNMNFGTAAVDLSYQRNSLKTGAGKEVIV